MPLAPFFFCLPSFPDVLVHPLGAGLGPKDVARRIDGDAFGGAGGGGLFGGVRDEGGHDGIADTYDPKDDVDKV